MTAYKNPVCRGSWLIGNNCKTCERCLETKRWKHSYDDHIEEPRAMVSEEAALVEAAKWALKNASRGGLSEELCDLYVREVLAVLSKGPKT
jgi:hypothetical protein